MASGTASYDTWLRDTAVALTAAGIDNARFEARLLLAHAAGVTVEWLIAHGGEAASSATVEALRTFTARRIRREPMAYIVGEREFWGLPFKVSPAVLVPRPDSETLIEAALALMPGRAEPWRIADLGVGSGCLLLTLLREFPNARGVGMDASAAALEVTRANAEAFGVAAVGADGHTAHIHQLQLVQEVGGRVHLQAHECQRAGGVLLVADAAFLHGLRLAFAGRLHALQLPVTREARGVPARQHAARGHGVAGVLPHDDIERHQQPRDIDG